MTTLTLGYRSQRCTTLQKGFTVAEMVISAAILLIASVGSAMLFLISNRQSLKAREIQEQPAAVSEDLAAIQRMNDRYSCTKGPSACEVLNYDPNERQYYPAGPSNDVGFNTLCSNGRLINTLLTSINTLPRPSSFNRLKITRRDAVQLVDPESEPRTHRYLVTWVNEQSQQILQITLVPTVANWCP